MERAALWTFGWSVTWLLYTLLRVLVPSVFFGGVFGVAMFGFGLLVGLSTLSTLRRYAQSAPNPERIYQLVRWSYGFFGAGFLVMFVAFLVWLVGFVSAR